jgi:hypothetical protein
MDYSRDLFAFEYDDLDESPQFEGIFQPDLDIDIDLIEQICNIHISPCFTFDEFRKFFAYLNSDEQRFDFKLVDDRFFMLNHSEVKEYYRNRYELFEHKLVYDEDGDIDYVNIQKIPAATNFPADYYHQQYYGIEDGDEVLEEPEICNIKTDFWKEVKTFIFEDELYFRVNIENIDWSVENLKVYTDCYYVR